MTKKRTKKRRIVEPLLHKDVQCRFAMFLQDFPPREFNRVLRDLFIDYLVERGHTNVRIDTKRLSKGIWALLAVLDTAEDHWELEILKKYSNCIMDILRANKGRETVSLSPAIVEGLIHFMEYHPAKRIDQKLRKLLLEFLEYDGSIEAGYLNDLLYDLEGHYKLLDAIQENNDN